MLCITMNIGNVIFRKGCDNSHTLDNNSLWIGWLYFTLHNRCVNIFWYLTCETKPWTIQHRLSGRLPFDAEEDCSKELWGESCWSTERATPSLPSHSSQGESWLLLSSALMPIQVLDYLKSPKGSLGKTAGCFSLLAKDAITQLQPAALLDEVNIENGNAMKNLILLRH